jgi:hypothetical protein
MSLHWSGLFYLWTASGSIDPPRMARFAFLARDKTARSRCDDHLASDSKSFVISGSAGRTMEYVRKLSSFLPDNKWMPMGRKAGRLFPTVLLTGLGLALMLLSASIGFGDDPEVETLLLSPSAREVWQTRAKPQNSVHDRLNNSPLIREAERLALFLNPPLAKPVAPTLRAALSMTSTTTAGANPQQGPVARPRQSTAKFTLHATSYYPSSPDESIALIDEPGKGLHWVRQGTQVGYIVIQEIRTGMIVLRDGKRVREMLVESIKPPGAAPIPKPPSSGQYAKQMSGLTASPINSGSTSTRATGAARRDMVPLRNRPQRPARAR